MCWELPLFQISHGKQLLQATEVQENPVLFLHTSYMTSYKRLPQKNRGKTLWLRDLLQQKVLQGGTTVCLPLHSAPGAEPGKGPGRNTQERGARGVTRKAAWRSGRSREGGTDTQPLPAWFGPCSAPLKPPPPPPPAVDRCSSEGM